MTEFPLYFILFLSKERSIFWKRLFPSHGEAGRPIWEKFLSYQDADQYFFLQEWWDCSESHQLCWSYFPPQKFKILLYFPEQDTFYVSYPYEQYAFLSYFRVDLSEREAGPLRAVLLFVTVNLVTQVILNGILSLEFRNFYVFIRTYLWAELLVFLLEAAVYAHYLPKISAAPQKKSKVVLYAFAANALSFAGGFAVSLLEPNRFF